MTTVTSPRTFSKSKLMACLQCEKRLWLEVHRPQLREDSAASKAAFATGHSVGEVARRLYDPRALGHLVDKDAIGITGAIAQTGDLLKHRKPLFEAGFMAGGALAFVDVLLPVQKGGRPQWRLVEVKASTEVKDEHRDDVAVQAYVTRKAGLPLAALAVARVDSKWVYPGGGDYRGLLVEEDLTREAVDRAGEVEDWIATAQAIAARRKPPEIATGPHCTAPHPCGYIDHCMAAEPLVRYPAIWLPRIQSRALKALIHEDGVRDMREVPDALLNPLQQRVKTCTLKNSVHFDAAAAKAALAPHGFPAYFLDFETVNFGVPIWKGTRPYQQIPFQFSLHTLSRSGKIDHHQFLDLSGDDPSAGFAAALLGVIGDGGPVYVYNKTFEANILRGLAERIPKLERPLQQIVTRMIDLLPITRDHYYHPGQQGSWSIKAVLPAIAPDLDYDSLEGVQDGTMASMAYAEAIRPEATADRKAAIRQQLEAYCRLDTLAMVRLWSHLGGRTDKRH